MSKAADHQYERMESMASYAKNASPKPMRFLDGVQGDTPEETEVMHMVLGHYYRKIKELSQYGAHAGIGAIGIVSAALDCEVDPMEWVTLWKKHECLREAAQFLREILNELSIERCMGSILVSGRGNDMALLMQMLDQKFRLGMNSRTAVSGEDEAPPEEVGVSLIVDDDYLDRLRKDGQ